MTPSLPARLRQLCLSFLKIGAFTFGGGYAMISLLQTEFVSRRGWISEEEFLDLAAIAESTPGPIAINAATYIGYRTVGFWGALLATVCLCLPSFAVIWAISLFFDAFLALPLVAGAFRGIQVCVVVLIFSAGLRMLRSVKRSPFERTVLLLTLICSVTLSVLGVRFSSVLFVLIAGLAGLFLFLLHRASAPGKGEKK